MWIEISCWMDLGRSLESYFLFPGAPRSCVLSLLGLLPQFASQSYMYARLLPAVSHSLVDVVLFLTFGWLSVTLSFTRSYMTCDIMNIHLDRQKSVSATG